MAEKLQSWLRSKLSGGGGAPRVELGAFGKHPGWPEHIDGFLGDDQLVSVKTSLYGIIEDVIGKGEWRKLDEAGHGQPFGHLFVWEIGGDITVGRIWESRDYKDRPEYPMVVFAACSGLPMAWVIAQVVPELEKIERACKQAAVDYPPASRGGTEATRAQAGAAVRGAIETGRTELTARAKDAGPAVPPGSDRFDALPILVDRLERCGQPDAIARLLFVIKREMSAYSASAGSSSRTGALRPQHIRVPGCSNSDTEAARLWMNFLFGELGAEAPLLAIVPSGAAWVDLVVGKPTARELECLRTAPAGLPLTTDIPYPMDEQFLASVAARVDAVRPRATPAAQPTPSAAIEDLPEPKPVIPIPRKISPPAPIPRVPSPRAPAPPVPAAQASAPPDESRSKAVPIKRVKSASDPKGPPPFTRWVLCIAVAAGVLAVGLVLRPMWFKTSVVSVQDGKETQPPPATAPIVSLGADPRQDGARLFADINTSLAELRQIEANFPAPVSGSSTTPVASKPRTATDFEMDLTALNKRHEALSHMAWDQANQARIVSEWEKLQPDVARATDAIRGVIVAGRDRQAVASAWLQIAEQDARLSSPVLQQKWTALRSEWTAMGKSSGGTPSELKKIQSAQALLQSLDVWGTSLLGQPKTLPAVATALDRALSTGLAEAKIARKEKILGEVLATISWDNPPSSEASANDRSRRTVEFSSWSMQADNEIDQFSKNGAAAQTQLDEGWGLSTAPPGGSSVDDLLKKLDQSSWRANPAVQSATKPLQERAAVLREIASSTDAGKLRESMQDKNPLEVRLAAWRKLAEAPKQDWLSNVGRFKTDWEASTSLIDELKKANSRWGGRGDKAVADIDKSRQEGRQRLLVAATTLADLKIRMQLANEVSSEPVPAGVPADPSLAFDLQLLELQKLLENKASTETIGSALSELQNRAKKVPKGGEAEDFNSFMKKLDLCRKPDLSKAGPMLVGNTLRGFPPDPLMLQVEQTLQLEFILVSTANDRSVDTYLCRTETALKVFRKAFWPPPFENMTKLMGTPRSVTLGIRVWNKPDELKAASDWELNGFPMISRSPPVHDKIKLIDPLPTDEHPMQYVSPAAAIYFASLLGCRLMTTDEWVAADALNHQSEEKGAFKILPNLRDPQWQVMNDARKNISAEWMGHYFDSIPPSPTATSKPVLPDDKFALFDKVGPNIKDGPPDRPKRDEPFPHLRGNVWEYVLDEASEPAPGAKEPAAKFSTYARDNLKHLGVIGGSAFSPPGLTLDKKWPLPDKFEDCGQGWSDVGIRLAFNVPRVLDIAQVRELVSKTSCYLPPNHVP